ncbi:MAG: ADP-ribosylglycohydrolase family protein, partial [Dehalococcoidia bacterium]|nr:ADP-ribosylglycohydrolase family protein [Dehalococcoidia bacterium]
ERRYGRVTELFGGGWLGLGAGEWTDDTAMMLCIARSIVGKGCFDPQDVALKFLGWFRAGALGIGRTTCVALEALSTGAPWQDAGRIAHERLGGLSAGNGSIMRCAPIGLLDFKDPQRLIRDSINSSLITHWDPMACWGAAALNLAISQLLCDDKGDLPDKIGGKIEQPEVRQAVAKVEIMKLEDVVASGFVLDTLQAALWCFLNTSSFEDALLAAVNLGGDTDTIGAVCGALAGACYGMGEIPSRWQQKLAGRVEIIELAERIYELAQAGK